MGNFGKFTAALKDAGIDLTSGDYTILAPSDSAFEKHEKEVGTPITADILKYHVIPGKVSMDGLNTDQKTLNGGTLTAYRKFRKNWLDGAIIGLKSEGPSKSSSWPSDVVRQRHHPRHRHGPRAGRLRRPAVSASARPRDA